MSEDKPSGWPCVGGPFDGHVFSEKTIMDLPEGDFLVIPTTDHKYAWYKPEDGKLIFSRVEKGEDLELISK